MPGGCGGRAHLGPTGHARQRPAGIADEAGQEPREPAQVVGDAGRVVHLGVAGEVDPQAVVCRVVDGDGQILHRPRGQRLHRARAAREIEVAGKGQVVDDRREQWPIRCGDPEIAPDVLQAVPLVRAGRCRFPGHLPDQLFGAGGGRHPHPDRHDVRHHSRRAPQRGRGAAQPHLAHDHLAGPTQAGEVGRDGRGQHLLRAGGGGPGQPAQARGQVEGQSGAGAHDSPLVLGPPAGQVDRVRAVSQPRPPELTVHNVLLGGAVGRVVGAEQPVLAQAGTARAAAGDQCRVDGRDPRVDQGQAEAVHGDVVRVVDPDVPLVGQAHQRRGEQRPVQHAQAPSGLGGDPLAGRRVGIALAGEVDEPQRGVRAGGDDLSGCPVPLDQPQAEHLGLGQHAPDGLGEGVPVQWSPHVDPLGDAVGVAAGIEQLPGPDSPLAGQQWELRRREVGS